MKKHTIVLPIDDPRAIPRAMRTLKKGGIIVFPTDTLYGLAADFLNPEAIQTLFMAKNRPIEKAIPILIGNCEHIDSLTPAIDARIETVMKHYWPGALTLVLQKKANLPAELSQTDSIGIRMPDHPFALKLLEHTGPLATTSANISGAPNPLNAYEVLQQLNGRVDLILDGGSVSFGEASTVIDCTGEEPIVLRSGPISLTKILEVWKS